MESPYLDPLTSIMVQGYSCAIVVCMHNTTIKNATADFKVLVFIFKWIYFFTSFTNSKIEPTLYICNSFLLVEGYSIRI